MKVIKMEIPESQPCLIPAEDDDYDAADMVKSHVEEMILCGAVGEKLTITLLEMSREDIDALPEWDGF